MKFYLKKILKFVFRILAFLIPYRLLTGFASLKNYLYAEIVKRTFKSCDENFILEYPAFLYGQKHIEIGKDFYASRHLRLEAYDFHNNYKFSPIMKIGNNTRFGFDCHVGCINKIIIGDNVLFGSKIFITDHFHGDTTKEELIISPNNRKVFSKGPVIIENDVWIGEGVVIMPNVTIGHNSVIGANSVVTKDVPPFSVVAGIPAKIIKQFSI